MSTVMVSIILIGGIVLLIMAFNMLNKRNRKKKEQELISLFNQTGEKHGLSFSSQEILHHKVIGLDGINKKFVMVGDGQESNIVSLDEVKNCVMKKNFETYKAVDKKDSGYEKFVSSIVLLFEFKNKKQPVQVSFYDNLLHPVAEEKIMETKAKDWETILSKMISSSEEVRA
jgi:hypothetical protein